MRAFQRMIMASTAINESDKVILIDTPSDRIIHFIAQKEGFRSVAYFDNTGMKWTIGYGTTVYSNGKKVQKGDTITEPFALEELVICANKKAKEIRTVHRHNFTQHQFDALVSFVYNLGITKYKGYTLCKLIDDNPGNNEAIAEAFQLYVFSGKRKRNGLVIRRAQEAAIYTGGNYAA